MDDPVNHVIIALLNTLLGGQTEIIRQLRRIERREIQLMALTQREQEAIDRLVVGIDTAIAALKASTQGLKAQITALEILRDELQAKDDIDVAAVAAANDVITGLQATLASQESDVVGALDGVGEHIKSLTPAP